MIWSKDFGCTSASYDAESLPTTSQLHTQPGNHHSASFSHSFTKNGYNKTVLITEPQSRLVDHTQTRRPHVDVTPQDVPSCPGDLPQPGQGPATPPAACFQRWGSRVSAPTDSLQHLLRQDGKGRPRGWVSPPPQQVHTVKPVMLYSPSILPTKNSLHVVCLPSMKNHEKVLFLDTICLGMRSYMSGFKHTPFNQPQER